MRSPPSREAIRPSSAASPSVRRRCPLGRATGAVRLPLENPRTGAARKPVHLRPPTSTREGRPRFRRRNRLVVAARAIGDGPRRPSVRESEPRRAPGTPARGMGSGSPSSRFARARVSAGPSPPPRSGDGSRAAAASLGGTARGRLPRRRNRGRRRLPRGRSRGRLCLARGWRRGRFARGSSAGRFQGPGSQPRGDCWSCAPPPAPTREASPFRSRAEDGQRRLRNGHSVLAPRPPWPPPAARSAGGRRTPSSPRRAPPAIARAARPTAGC